MTASQMTATQVQRFTRICEDQGARVTRTKKGLLIRFPDGTSTVQHFTNSDVRAMQNQISRFRRAGMVHPNDTRPSNDLPTYITSGTISAKTKKRIVDLMRQLDFPEAVLSSTVVKETGMDPGWANRALYHSGFRPGPAKSKKVGRPWYTPEDILELKDQAKTEDEVAQTPMPQEGSDEIPRIGLPDPVVERALSEIEDDATDEHEAAMESERFTIVADPVAYPPSPEAYAAEGFKPGELVGNGERVPVPRETSDVKKDGDREYIDTHNSWAVDMETLLGEHLNRQVQERLEVLRVVGMDYEIRVWRKPE